MVGVAWRDQGPEQADSASASVDLDKMEPIMERHRVSKMKLILHVRHLWLAAPGHTFNETIKHQIEVIVINGISALVNISKGRRRVITCSSSTVIGYPLLL